jgi:hypothetical protein
MMMNVAGLGLSYLVLRELPMRNFYARSIIMAAFAYKMSKTWSFSIFDKSLSDKTDYIVPEHYLK